MGTFRGMLVELFLQPMPAARNELCLGQHCRAATGHDGSSSSRWPGSPAVPRGMGGSLTGCRSPEALPQHRAGASTTGAGWLGTADAWGSLC